MISFLIYVILFVFGSAGSSCLLSPCSAWASLVVEHGLQGPWAPVVAAPGSKAQLNSRGCTVPGIKPMSPSLAGGFSPLSHQGKPEA